MLVCVLVCVCVGACGVWGGVCGVLCGVCVSSQEHHGAAGGQTSVECQQQLHGAGR